MRVLHLVTRSDSGGAQCMIATLAALQSQSGHVVAVASGLEGKGLAWHSLPAAIEKLPVKHLKRNIAPWDESVSAIRNSSYLHEMEARYPACSYEQSSCPYKNRHKL